MKLIIYPRLSTRSKRAFIRTTKKFGRPYRYVPRHQLIDRLTKELNLNRSQVLAQIQKERAWLIKHQKYFM